MEGSSYLWHQIRCIVAVLLLVGQKKEAPSIIDDLLDIEKYPCKPQYSICSELPLVLFDCQYENTSWILDREELTKLIVHFQDLWTQNQSKAVVIKRMIDFIQMDLEKNTDDEEEATREKSPYYQKKASLLFSFYFICISKLILTTKIKRRERRDDDCRILINSS